MVNTRDVAKQLYKNYIQKALECLESSRTAFAKSHWNSCVINAVHAGISAADALTVFFLGKRCAGERHAEVIALLKQLDFPQELQKKFQQLSALLDIKDLAEYEEKLVSQQDAEAAVKNAERFLAWVKEKTSPP